MDENPQDNNEKSSEERFRRIFEDSPIAIWEEDFSCFNRLKKDLARQGIINIRKHLLSHSRVANRVFKGIKVIDVNKAALRLYGAKTKSELIRRFGKTFTAGDLKVLTEQFVAFIGKEKIFESEFRTRCSQGKNYDLWLRVAVPNGYEESLARVIVTIEDITVRKKNENYLRRVAQEDSLTGLLNHKAVEGRLQEELNRSRRYNAPISCLMLDLDYFKPINDNFGHQIGDKMLKQVGLYLKKLLRATDLIGRYGGDEFLILLTATDRAGAVVVAERIRENMSQKRFHLGEKITIKNTLSIGLTSYPANRARNAREIIHLADKALYQAKADGRNCCRAM